MGDGRDSPRGAAMKAAPADMPADRAEPSGGFDHFYAQQYTSLSQFVRRRSAQREDAEDVTQESFARFLPYVQDKPQAAWKPTLYRIALNVLNDRLRRMRSQHTARHVPLEGLEVESGEPALDDRAAHAQQQALIRQAIRMLPPQRRQVVLLRFVRGLNNEQVAARCGISTRMVRKHLADAMLRMQAAVRADHVRRSGGGRA